MYFSIRVVFSHRRGHEMIEINYRALAEDHYFVFRIVQNLSNSFKIKKTSSIIVHHCNLENIIWFIHLNISFRSFISNFTNTKPRHPS